MNKQTKQNMFFYPIISCIQKIALYETKCHFYLMGSNNTLTRFRVLKIDRMEPHELVLIDDKIEYTQDEIKDLVKMIDMGNRNRTNQRSNTNGLAKLVSAFGIIGFIRFLEGYYIILITKRRKIAVIGHHTIYKIEDTSMIYIPNDSIRFFHPDEQRYLKMFQSIDLSSNFYFSYSYDLTHTLQNNASLLNCIKNDEIPRTHKKFHVKNGAENFCKDSEKNRYNKKTVTYGIRSNPHKRFIWNSHLLPSVQKNLHQDWILFIIHGFIGQSNVSIFGKSMYITVIARRSNKYAGTRFLKRGANFEGDVANEVETEQIVHDSSVSSLSNGRFSSFVQMRGSVPCHWSQDISKMVPKPTITIDLPDPFIETAGAHFNELLKRYGSPIIILNLVKKREKKKHESTLSEEMYMAVKYLNQFLPIEYNIQYISFDMARKNKGKEANVMKRLANIANNAVLKTSIFQSLYTCYNKSYLFNIKKFHKLEYNSTLMSLKKSDDFYDSLKLSSVFNDTNNSSLINKEVRQYFSNIGSLQTGIIRTNCVDCLDRTNTAQFAIGKCALGYQLYSLGIINSPKLEFDTDCVRMLEELYEDHGDTLALQYGGSQLVHRIRTYRKTAPWTSQGNDIMQTLSRYYSNTFSDQEKQQTINLFLGLFIPEEGKPSIWELITDYYIHHKPACTYTQKSKILTQWWDKIVFSSLPYALFDITKSCAKIIQVQNNEEEMIDVYYDYYRPYELSFLSDIYAYQVSHSVRDFMPHFTTNFSPFVVRVRPGRRREESSNKNINIKNPSLTGHSSASSTPSSGSSSVTSSDDEENYHLINQIIVSKKYLEKSFKILFPSMSKVYGIQLEYPKRSDIILYKRFLIIIRNEIYKLNHLEVQYKFLNENSASKNENKILKPFYTSNNTISIYEQYLKKGKYGASMPNPNDKSLYEKFIYQQQLCLGILFPNLI